MEKSEKIKKENYRDYRPVHSDFLIHWTGKDIDDKYHPDWDDDHSSITDKRVTELYIERLKNILKYGLWMTEDVEDKSITINSKEYNRPRVARTCFTELKLSQARSHAKEYGRLGIGFKRFFLIERLGSPMIYFQNTHEHWISPQYKIKKHSIKKLISILAF